MKRNCSMLLRFTKEELDEITDKAWHSNYSREEFCRKILKGCTLQEAPPAQFYSLIKEVKRVGANLDQLLKLAHTYHLLNADEVQKTLDGIYEVQLMLWNAFFPQS